VLALHQNQHHDNPELHNSIGLKVKPDPGNKLEVCLPLILVHDDRKK